MGFLVEKVALCPTLLSVTLSPPLQLYSVLLCLLLSDSTLCYSVSSCPAVLSVTLSPPVRLYSVLLCLLLSDSTLLLCLLLSDSTLFYSVFSWPCHPTNVPQSYLFIGRHCYIILASDSVIKRNTPTLLYVNCLCPKTNRHIVTGENRVNYFPNNEGWLSCKTESTVSCSEQNLQGLRTGTLQKVSFN
jgi:hypothetical protein